MGTNNFSYENILVVIPDFNLYHDCEYHIDEALAHKCDCDSCSYKGQDKECERKGEYEEFDDIAYDDYIKTMRTKLEKIGFTSCNEWDNNRSYEGKIIAKWGLEDNDGMIKWLEVVVRSGYYSGANIDYTIDGDFGIENEDNKKEVTHYEAMGRKFDRMVVKTEKILREEYTGKELLKVAQFSNGEAVYKLKE